MADKTDKQEGTPSRRHPANIPKIFASGDVETVRAEFRALYGHEVSEHFVNDLMAFVKKAVKGDYAE